MDYVGGDEEMLGIERYMLVFAGSKKVSKRSCVVEGIDESTLFFLGKILPTVWCFCTMTVSV
jgi:hypothetical protein